jgi:hypothetical protein
VFGKRLRLVALDERGKAIEMPFVKRLFGANRQAHPMNGEGVVFANPLQVVMEGTTCNHVILGMHLEEADRGLVFEYLPVVLGLEAYACP